MTRARSEDIPTTRARSVDILMTLRSVLQTLMTGSHPAGTPVVLPRTLTTQTPRHKQFLALLVHTQLFPGLLQVMLIPKSKLLAIVMAVLHTGWISFPSVNQHLSNY